MEGVILLLILGNIFMAVKYARTRSKLKQERLRLQMIHESFNQNKEGFESFAETKGWERLG